MVKRSLNKSINPEAGFYVGMKLDIEKNQSTIKILKPQKKQTIRLKK